MSINRSLWKQLLKAPAHGWRVYRYLRPQVKRIEAFKIAARSMGILLR